MLKKEFILFFIMSIFVEAQDYLKLKYEVSTEIDIDNMKINGINLKDTNLVDAVLQSSKKKYYYELLANKKESNFNAIEKIDNEQPPEPGSIVIKMDAGGKYLYKNYVENIILDEKNFLNKKFIVLDSLKDYNWKITKERKTILEYEVIKAISLADSTKSIVAWYAPKIPFKDGPFTYWGLPGLILELEIQKNGQSNGKTRFLAVAISTSDEKKKVIRPEKGELISLEEYKKKVKEFQDKEINYFQDGVDTSN